MTEPNSELFNDKRTKTILLNGVKWPVPRLAPKQNEVIVPLVLDILPKILGLQEIVLGPDKKPVLDGDGNVKKFIPVAKMGAFLTKERIHDLGTIVFTALTKGHPAMKREEFDDMPTGIIELLDAIIAISEQTGVLRPAPDPFTKQKRRSRLTGEE